MVLTSTHQYGQPTGIISTSCFAINYELNRMDKEDEVNEIVR